MSGSVYDVVIVGGGFAGSSLAVALAGHGRRVAVLERERRFRDRVRGEVVYPWGVEAGVALGLTRALGDVAQELDRWDTQITGLPFMQRQLSRTTPSGRPALAFSHPAAQERLLQAASAAGADVRRDVVAVAVDAGDGVVTTREGPARRRASYRGRIVVGADGRDSTVRRLGGFHVNRDPAALVLAGALLQGGRAPSDRGHVAMDPGSGLLGMALPQPGGRTRIYAGYHMAKGALHLSGTAALPALLGTASAAGLPPQWLEGVTAVGPVAEFAGADVFVDRPWRGRVALIGDAADTSDPSWGAGLALAWLDVAALASASSDRDDVALAEDAYVAEHAAHHGSVRAQTAWLRTVLRTPGPKADAVRRDLMPLLAEDMSLAPDIVGSGPHVMGPTTGEHALSWRGVAE